MSLTKGRGRRWQPKYKCVCQVCGWTGKRTKGTMSYPCPRCWDYLQGIGMNVHDKFRHIGAIGEDYRTVKKKEKE